MDEEDEQLLIPYFTFRDLPEKQLLSLRIHIDKLKYHNVKFKLHEKEIVVSTEKYKKYKYFAKIYLPVEVIKPKENKLQVNYNDEAGSYEILLQKNSKMLSSGSVKIPDLDLISPYLSWRDHQIQDQPEKAVLLAFSAQNGKSDAEKVVESLQDLKITIENQNFKSSNLIEKDIVAKSKIGSYGFTSQYMNKLDKLEDNWRSFVELPEPDNSDPKDRRMLRWENERQKFDVEHYLADFFLERPDDDDDPDMSILQRSILFEPYWHKIKQPCEKVLHADQMVVLAGLPCKKFNLTETERLEVLHSLLDIILAYAYDYRLTNGKYNSESAWNINKLSATLSWFQVHKNVGEAVESFIRRSLTFPMYRCWLLTMSAFKDALEIFSLGRRQILNCLIAIHGLLDDDDDRKILNELYIDDYLIWIQQVQPRTIKKYVKLIQSCFRVKKENVIAELPAIEDEAMSIFKEHPVAYDSWFRDIGRLSKAVQNRPINRGEISDSSSESSSDSEESSTDSSESETSSESEYESSSQSEADIKLA